MAGGSSQESQVRWGHPFSSQISLTPVIYGIFTGYNPLFDKPGSFSGPLPSIVLIVVDKGQKPDVKLKKHTLNGTGWGPQDS